MSAMQFCQFVFQQTVLLPEHVGFSEEKIEAFVVDRIAIHVYA